MQGPFTTAENEAILEHWDESTAHLAAMLGRSVNAVTLQRRVLEQQRLEANRRSETFVDRMSEDERRLYRHLRNFDEGLTTGQLQGRMGMNAGLIGEIVTESPFFERHDRRVRLVAKYRVSLGSLAMPTRNGRDSWSVDSEYHGGRFNTGEL